MFMSLFSGHDSHLRTVYNWLQCFDKESIAAEFGRSGLGIRAFFSNVAGEDYSDQSAEMAVVAGNE